MAKYKLGQSGNPAGRPKGAIGKASYARRIITEVFMEHSDDFRAALEAKAKKDITSFYQDYVKPIMPAVLAISMDQYLSDENEMPEESYENRIKRLRKARGLSKMPESKHFSTLNIAGKMKEFEAEDG